VPKSNGLLHQNRGRPPSSARRLETRIPESLQCRRKKCGVRAAQHPDRPIIHPSIAANHVLQLHLSAQTGVP
jgi:hypothetical protein